jgi:hypothetical protein
MKTKITTGVLLLSSLICHGANYKSEISLDGPWKCVLSDYATDTDSYILGTTAEVLLPGTTDTNGLGQRSPLSQETTHLTRNFSFLGKGSYSRTITIPKGWRNKTISLYIERSKPCEVYIDGVKCGQNDNISTAQRFDLSTIKPGMHELTIVVDNTANSVPPQLLGSSHAYTEDTQTNWNGLIGDIHLEAIDQIHLGRPDIRYNAANHSLSIDISVYGKPNTKYKASVKIGDNTAKELSLNVGSNHITLDVANLELWSEFHPTLHDLTIELKGHDSYTTRVGLCDFKAGARQFSVNGNVTFLRGKHDACVFPLTGHVPMDMASWQRYFRICKEYGINHVRFHSWCPPEACFEAADIEGIYLQPELPFWGNFDKNDSRLMEFLKKEGLNIIEEYGNHPSFVMMALGNELWGDIDAMKEFTNTFRAKNDRILYTFGSNFYLGYQGYQDGMDYMTTCRNGGEAWGDYNTHTRGSFSFADALDGGIINHLYPNSSTTLSDGCKSSPVPVISHETGQFQSYPSYSEIAKYTGALRADNLQEFQQRLTAAGMADQAEAFHKASGAWATLLYKADIELDLRTREMAGFQLLDLQDYPGQGSAYIGILDAFMDSKGYITPQQWRGFCSPTVPLLATDKFCYSSTENFKGDILLANYSETNYKGKKLQWHLTFDNGKDYANGNYFINNSNNGVNKVCDLDFDLSTITKAEKLTMTISVDDHINSYPIWVYPPHNDFSALEAGITITNRLTDNVLNSLQDGATMLYIPDSTEFKDNYIGPLFQTDYWNYRMFRTICENNHKEVSPGTLGLLIDDNSKMFNEFPTDSHTNWQWFSIIKASRSLIIDTLPAEIRPTVQSIDNVERNHRLAVVLECKVGKGRLLLCMAQLRDHLDKPEVASLYHSILQYMHSDAFAPSQSLTTDMLRSLLTAKSHTTEINELNNISFE